MKIPQRRIDFLDWELGVFFHFGIRTFYEGHRDWDMKPMPAEGFNPTQLDCRQWLKCVKDSGATYAILVCKHHDGFANWPSKYTDYSVANTPWKDGKGDVVQEFVDACREFGIKVGLYYSPAQFGSVKMDHKEYDDYFINQISELLTNYGKIDYLWFDGCGSENHEYDTLRITKEIRRMQPEILIFNMWDPDTHWIGNESGIASMDDGPLVNTLDFSVQTKRVDALDDWDFLPGECDMRIRSQWFYTEADADKLKSLEELWGIYLSSVGRSSNMLINIGPDRRGLLPEADVERMLELGEKIRTTFANPICTLADFTREGDNFTCTVPGEQCIRYVVLEEELSETGGAVTDFEIGISPSGFGRQKKVYRGWKVGRRQICQLPCLAAKELVVTLTGNGYKMKDIRLY